VFKLPSMSGRAAALPLGGVADGPDALMGHAIIWMKQATEAITQLQERADSLDQERDRVSSESRVSLEAASLRNEELALQVAHAKARESTALALVEASEGARIELEQRVERLRQHPLARAARKLGLIRLVR